MSERVKISVIIPVYNGENYLERAIQSVLDQTYPAHEIIVIDDGSTDGTPDILKRFGGTVISRRITNSGPAVSRNLALSLSTGDWVAFLDHDDVWFRNKLEKQVEAAQRHPTAGFITCNFAVRYAHLDNRMMRHFSILEKPELLNFDGILKENPFRVLIEEHFVGTSSAVLISKKLVNQVGQFDPRFRSTQDYEYWLRCAPHTDFVVLKDILFYKKNHPRNISQNTVRTHSFRKTAIEEALVREKDYILKHHLEKICLQALADCHFYLGNLQFEAGQIFQAYGSYGKGFATAPNAQNTLKFLKSTAKKTIRLLSFNLISKQKLSLLRTKRNK